MSFGLVKFLKKPPFEAYPLLFPIVCACSYAVYLGVHETTRNSEITIDKNNYDQVLKEGSGYNSILRRVFRPRTFQIPEATEVQKKLFTNN